MLSVPRKSHSKCRHRLIFIYSLLYGKKRILSISAHPNFIISQRHSLSGNVFYPFFTLITSKAEGNLQYFVADQDGINILHGKL